MRKLELPKLREHIEEDLWTQSQCATYYGCSLSAIERRCASLGLRTQRTGPRAGKGHPNWKGGRYKSGEYVYLYNPDHPFSTKNGRVLEHRLVMESHLKRYLLPTEVVHHRNGIRDDNRLENLECFATNAEHLKHELSGKIPKWTPEGRARMSGGSEWKASRNQSAGHARRKARPKKRR